MKSLCLQKRSLVSLLAALAFGVVNPAPSGASHGDRLCYVRGGGASWEPFNLWMRDLDTGVATQLTDNATIDNHPTLNATGEWIVWSSTRGTNEFNLFLAELDDVEGTVRQLTFNDGFPDRHPHFHPADPLILIWSSKDQLLDHPIEIASECSVPIIIEPPRRYERLNIMRLDTNGVPVETRALDMRDAWNQGSHPDIWRDDAASYVGHASFDHQTGNRIIFSGSIDGAGTEWEVFTVEVELVGLDLVGDSLRRRTHGPALGPNPIQMSAGAHFSHDGTEIFFSTTRTSDGRSRVFRMPANVEDFPANSATPLTAPHGGNDYLPQPLPDGRVLVTTDWDAVGGGRTERLRLSVIEPNGDITPVTDPGESADEMRLIGDEVSWFCGVVPNLTANTYYPRVFSAEALWLMWTAHQYTRGFAPDTPIPPDLLDRFGYPDQAIRMYAFYWMLLEAMMWTRNPEYFDNAMTAIWGLHYYGGMTGTEFPGMDDPEALEDWLAATAEMRKRKFALPSVMHERGIGAPWTPWVTRWQYSQWDNDADDPWNWNLGIPGPDDIARFDERMFDGWWGDIPDTVDVRVPSNGVHAGSVEIDFESIPIEMSTIKFGSAVEPIEIRPTLNAASNITVNAGMNVVISNLNVTVGGFIVPGEPVLTSSPSIWSVDSVLDITVGLDYAGWGSGFNVGTGTVVRAREVDIGGSNNLFRVEMGGLLVVSNSSANARFQLGGDNELEVEGEAGFDELNIEGVFSIRGQGTVQAGRIALPGNGGVLLVDTGAVVRAGEVMVGGEASVGNVVRVSGLLDVTGDGAVGPVDALMVVNALNRCHLEGGTIRADDMVIAPDADLTGDGLIAPTDVLQTINVLNSGGISPGQSTGILTIDGNLAMSETAILNIELAGTTPGTGHDQLQVTGHAGLGGTLNVGLLDGFTPQDGDAFATGTHGSSADTFATSFLPALPPGLLWERNYDPGGLTLNVHADSDGDGIPDYWETAHFGGPTPADASAFASNNVMTVREAYLADLDPADPDAIFVITAIVLEDGVPRIHWRGGVNAVQTLYRAETLVNVTNAPAAIRIVTPPTPVENNLPDADAADRPSAFYWLEAER